VRARIAVVVYFAALGLANGVWLARIPAIKHSLHLTDGVLGLALLSAPAGLVVVVLFASRIVHQVGSRRPTIVAGTCTSLVPIGLGFAPSLPTLMAALFAFGLTGGMLDVAMNSQAVLVERRMGRPLMTSFHACYSFGALAGALLGGLFAWVGIGPAINFAIVSIPLAGAAIVAGRWLVPDEGGNAADPLPAVPPSAAAPAASATPALAPAPAAAATPALDPAPATAAAGARSLPGRPLRRLPASWTPALLLMALLATCSLLGEGAADGWSAVYLRDNIGSPAGLAALAYAGFSVAMAVGRLSGDRLSARFGASVLMRWCGVIAAVGLALGLLSRDAAAAIAGFAVFGAGLSCTFPLLLSAAGNSRPDQPAQGIARVAGFGYAGMLGGPVLIGGLATAFGLRWALALPVLLALAIAVGARVVGPGFARAPGDR
jgi:MFS family permease